MKNREDKIKKIIRTVETRISDINDIYIPGPDMYFYNNLFSLRSSYDSVEAFLQKDENIKDLYVTLLAWDMNCRGAKMKDYYSFRSNILSCIDDFVQLEEELAAKENITFTLMEAYTKLDFMYSRSKLVANSKLFHFLFPESLMPANRANTLNYFYGNENDADKKYNEIIKVSFEIMDMADGWDKYLDDEWNKTIPKMIDNAITLLIGKNVNFYKQPKESK